MSKRPVSNDAPFLNIVDASKKTGLSTCFIRKNIKDIPHCKSGKKYMIYVDGLLEWANKLAYEQVGKE